MERRLYITSIARVQIWSHNRLSLPSRCGCVLQENETIDSEMNLTATNAYSLIKSYELSVLYGKQLDDNKLLVRLSTNRAIFAFFV